LNEGTGTPEKEAEKIGGNLVTMFWRFKALKPGATTIELNYFKIWEGKGTAVKHFDVAIQFVP